MLDVERRANGGPGVMRGRLHVHFTEVRPFKNPSIGYAVQRHAAGQAESACARLLLNEVQQSEVILFQNQLDRCRKIHVALLDFGARCAGFAELLGHLRGEDGAKRRLAAVPGHFDAFECVREIVQIEPALAPLGANHLPYSIRETRLAIGGETHHFVFVAVLGKAEELRERRVEDAEGVRKQDRALDLDPIALAEAPHDAAEVAETVDRNDGGVFEGRGEERAGQVGAVMLHEMKVGGIFGVNSFGAKHISRPRDAYAIGGAVRKLAPSGAAATTARRSLSVRWALGSREMAM